jgi:hypothetical protein
VKVLQMMSFDFVAFIEQQVFFVCFLAYVYHLPLFFCLEFLPYGAYIPSKMYMYVAVCVPVSFVPFCVSSVHAVMFLSTRTLSHYGSLNISTSRNSCVSQ